MKDFKLKFLIVVLLSSVVCSCSTFRKANYLPQDNLISYKDTNFIELNLDHRKYAFNLQTLCSEYITYQLPIINNNNLLNETDVVLSSNDLDKWNKTVKRFNRGDSIIFTVPGKLIVLLSKKKKLKDFKLTPDVIFSIINDKPYPEFGYLRVSNNSQYFALDALFYNNDINNELVSKYWGFVFRKIIRDKTSKCILVVDNIPLKGSEYILSLIYPIYGSESYFLNLKDEKIHYISNPIKSWNPMSNMLMATQQIKQQIDSISLSVSRSNIMQK